MFEKQWKIHSMGWGCGCGCEYEPLTKEEKVAILEKKEKILKEKLDYIHKIREELKSGKEAKA
jgi:hypothetical protein